jgi:hypothetical protein
MGPKALDVPSYTTYTFDHMSESKDDKKERVIHTRVPEQLDDEIKRRAGKLGLSVSNLVRNVLQNAFGLVGDIVFDSAEIARSARSDATALSRSGGRTAQPGRVLGWQTALLNINAVCDRCNAILAKGTEAAIAVVDGTGPRPIRCNACLEELTDDDAQS